MVSDLELAREWLEAYEPAPGEEATKAAIDRVARWIQAEIDARYLAHAKRLVRKRKSST